ncbi:MAG: type IV toxin-antitoxin system AbiEi family antitoxin domain-containing protein [Acidimicrobiia bacterium]
MSAFAAILIDHARANGGVITRAEALALGVPSASLHRMVRQGIFGKAGAGVYALPGFDDQHLVALRAACSKLGAVASHQSAARIHRLDRARELAPTVSVPIRRTKDFPGVAIHQLTDLTDEHIVLVRGLPVTGPERTIVDLAAVLSDGHLERIVDTSVAARRVNLAELNKLFMELGRQGKPGTRRLRRILETRASGYVAPESELERRLVKLIEESGLPKPDFQFKPEWLAPTNGRVDLAYPESMLIVEADGRRWHALLNSFESDRLRDNAAQLAGWRILRFTWKAVVDDPLGVAAAVRQALKISESRSYMTGTT